MWEANKEVGEGCVCCRMIDVPSAGGGIVCNCESSLTDEVLWSDMSEIVR